MFEGVLDSSGGLISRFIIQFKNICKYVNIRPGAGERSSEIVGSLTIKRTRIPS